MNEKSNSTQARITSLEVNESVVFSLNDVKFASVRSMASMAGVQFDRVFTTSLNRADRTITVTRVR